MSLYYRGIGAVVAASAIGQSRGNCCICGEKHNMPNKAKGYVSNNKCHSSMINLEDSLMGFNQGFRQGSRKYDPIL